jgi:hypothetical protein
VAMNILLYVDSDDQTINKRLIDIIGSKARNSRIEIIQNYGALTERVRQLPKSIDLAVLMAKDYRLLSGLVALKDFFDDIPIILILPDLAKETIAKATKLYPNFFGSMDSDFSLVGEVLEKMLDSKGNLFKEGMSMFMFSEVRENG